MDAEGFADTAFGAPARRPGDRWAFTYYHPAPLPRRLDLSGEVVLALSEADAALGLLNGLSRLITDPEVLLGPFLTREALASSRIEGTDATLTEVLQAEAAISRGRTSEDVDEVERYLAATRQGIELSTNLPISQRLVRQTHATLMQGVRGAEKPGELRRTPVWVGPAGAGPDDAPFVPPLPEHLPDLMTDWERFVNDPAPLPVLVRCALMHYQFETIHPFLDGNGRIGRLLIGLLLLDEGRLARPLLYLSGYLEAHRDEYYARLQAVRERGDVEGYLLFFLRAVQRQSEDAVWRAGRLVELRERHYEQCRLDRSRVAALVPLIFTTPFLSVRRVQRALQVTAPGARKLLTRAEEHGWLRPMGTTGRDGALVWTAQEVLDVIEAPSTYGTDDVSHPR